MNRRTRFLTLSLFSRVYDQSEIYTVDYFHDVLRATQGSSSTAHSTHPLTRPIRRLSIRLCLC
jgi:hypothetical protein